MARLAITLDIPMPEPDRILISVAWPYASGPRHIGHVAGFGVPSDVFARYQRLRGARVLMVSVTDEPSPRATVAESTGPDRSERTTFPPRAAPTTSRTTRGSPRGR